MGGSQAWSSQVITANKVIIEGANDYLLVYNGTPAAGNLIASIASQAGVDGFGNAYPAGISATSGFVSLSTVLMYSGVPALGNLVTSTAGVAGADSFGNQYPPGVTTYDRSNQAFANMQGGVSFWGALVSGQPDTAHAGVLLSTSIQLIMETPVTAVLSFLDALQMNMLSGKPGQTTGSNNTPQLGLLDASFSSPADLRLSGSVIKTDLTGVELHRQTVANGGVTLGTGWADDVTALGAQLIEYYQDGANNVVIVGNVHTTSATPAGVIFTLSAGPPTYRPKMLQRPPTNTRAAGVSSPNHINISSATGAVSLTTAITAANTDVSLYCTVPLGDLT